MSRLRELRIALEVELIEAQLRRDEDAADRIIDALDPFGKRRAAELSAEALPSDPESASR